MTSNSKGTKSLNPKRQQIGEQNHRNSRNGYASQVLQALLPNPIPQLGTDDSTHNPPLAHPLLQAQAQEEQPYPLYSSQFSELASAFGSVVVVVDGPVAVQHDEQEEASVQAQSGGSGGHVRVRSHRL